MSFETSHIRVLHNRRAASLRGTLLPARAGLGIGGNALDENPVNGFLVWLKLWLVVASRSETQRYIKNFLGGLLTDIFPHQKTNLVKGYQRPPSLLPDSARAAIAPQVLCGRRRRRIIARGLPASRRYHGLEYLNDRQLTGNQFLERACRLSVNGRVGIYSLEYRLRLCQRRHEVRRHDTCAGFADVSALASSEEGVSFGLSKFHLGPD